MRICAADRRTSRSSRLEEVIGAEGHHVVDDGLSRSAERAPAIFSVVRQRTRRLGAGVNIAIAGGLQHKIAAN
jgi:hypothetical protein